MNEEILQQILTTIPHDRVTMSENMDQYFAAFAEVQSEIAPIKKSSQGHGYKYANINTVLEEIMPILTKYGFSFYQSPLFIGGQDLLQTIIGHKSGQWMSFGSIRVIAASDEDLKFYQNEKGQLTTKKAQSLGAGFTYSRRYAMVCTVGLPQEDDDGEGISGDTPKRNNGYNGAQEPKKMISEKQVDTIKEKILNSCDTSQERHDLYKKILRDTKVDELSNLTEKQYYFVLKSFFQ